MAKPIHADFFLEAPLQDSAARGDHNFLRLFSEVLSEAGFAVRYRDIDNTSALMDAARHNITFMKEPLGRHGLVFRRLYHYPFWQIEKSAKRWKWDIAKAEFDPDTIDADAAQEFCNRWRKWIFGDTAQSAHDGHVLVALQGKLLQRRSFQSCAPIEMVNAVISHTSGPVIVSRHPNETYSETELKALGTLAEKHDRLHVTTGGSNSLLQGCKLVVTQNSGVAFDGYFLQKPALLFGKSEIHHVALQTTPDRLAETLARVDDHAPHYDKFLYWFWQMSAINAGRDDAKDKIRARLRRFDWPV